jgi:thymidylate synthase
MDEQGVKILIQAMLEPVLADVKELFKRTNDSGLWQAKYGEKIDKIEKLVEKLTESPAKRWDMVVSVVITAIVTGAIAFFMGKITGR